MYILRQLPFQDSVSFVEVYGEAVAIRAYQIIVWVSLSISEILDGDAPCFPAVLDTGYNHNFRFGSDSSIVGVELAGIGLPDWERSW